jgi:enoyl-CoA hydratase/carnithine racemase
MGGQKIPAQEALHFGLIDRVVTPENLMQSARDIAQATLDADPQIARGIKALCQ